MLFPALQQRGFVFIDVGRDVEGEDCKITEALPTRAQALLQALWAPPNSRERLKQWLEMGEILAGRLRATLGCHFLPGRSAWKGFER
jgi:23S rRNA A2030 N6-methylase RlmJ